MAHLLIGGANPRRLVHVFSGTEEMLLFVAGRFREIAFNAVSKKGFCAIALSGGTTTVPFYAALAKDRGVPGWQGIHVFLVDERFVPDTDSRSNYRMIRETLLDVASVPAENRHPMVLGELDARAAAERYEDELCKFFGGVAGSVPRFDLMLLGLGEDGHMASIFPGSPEVSEKRHLVRAVEPAEGGEARVTLTLPLINESRNIFFLVTGAGKAEAVKRVFKDRDPSLPASLVEAREGELTFVCDRESATLFSADHIPR